MTTAPRSVPSTPLAGDGMGAGNGFAGHLEACPSGEDSQVRCPRASRPADNVGAGGGVIGQALRRLPGHGGRNCGRRGRVSLKAQRNACRRLRPWSRTGSLLNSPDRPILIFRPRPVCDYLRLDIISLSALTNSLAVPNCSSASFLAISPDPNSFVPSWLMISWRVSTVNESVKARTVFS